MKKGGKCLAPYSWGCLPGRGFRGSSLSIPKVNRENTWQMLMSIILVTVSWTINYFYTSKNLSNFIQLHLRQGLRVTEDAVFPSRVTARSLPLTFPMSVLTRLIIFRTSIQAVHVCIKMPKSPQLVWFSGPSAGRFPVKAHTWVASQVPSWGCVRGNRSMYFSHIDVSLPLFPPSLPPP